MESVQVAGLLLAAGAGTRLGAPKALVTDPAGTPWVVRRARVLRRGGCTPVYVVVGAEAHAVRSALAAEPVTVVEAPDWATGMGASLRAGLDRVLHDAAAGAEAEAVVVAVVDTPGLSEDAIRRVAARAGRDVLARAVYGGRPGHPVLLGADHWAGVARSADGDLGAREYLITHEHARIECGDLDDGTDVDVADQLPPGHDLGIRASQRGS